MKFCLLQYEQHKLGNGGSELARVYGPFDDKDAAVKFVTEEKKATPTRIEGEYYDAGASSDCRYKYEIKELREPPAPPPAPPRKREKMVWDEANPNKKLVRMCLHQAFGSGDGVVEIYHAAWGFRDMDHNQFAMMQKHMEDNGLIEESGEPDYHRITNKGNDVLGGEDY